MNSKFGIKILCITLVSLGMILSYIDTSVAKRVDNRYIVLTILNKITAELEVLEIPVGEITSYKSFKIFTHKCYSRSNDERQKISALLEIYDAGPLRKKYKRIYAGWQFADKPYINAFEHPVYDIWLKNCTSSAQE